VVAIVVVVVFVATGNDDVLSWGKSAEIGEPTGRDENTSKYDSSPVLEFSV
jgi:hypothetical protein